MIAWSAGAILARVSTESDGPAQLEQLTLRTHRGPTGRPVPLVELAIDHEGRIGISPHDQHRNYAASARLRYLEHRETSGELSITQRDPATGITVTTVLAQADSAPNALRIRAEVRNDGSEPHRIQYVSSLNLCGFSDSVQRQAQLRAHVAYNSWMTEFRWQEMPMAAAGIVGIGPAHASASSHNRFPITNAGSWSTANYLPMGGISDPESGLAWAWQVEHNGAWHWELADHAGDVRLAVSGPTENEHQWAQILEPGDSFATVPVSIAVTDDGFGGALRELTAQRRAIRRANRDNERLPVIFNDYMNCLMGDPTTEKLLPLIESAAAAGAEYFVIDAGWYADAPQWWDTVGQWKPSSTRFPGGLREVTDRIRERGMIPGLWLEPEVIGVNSPAVEEYPAEAYFTRDGHRLTETGRHHLDFRHPAVTRRLDSIVDGLIHDFGVGYFKFDYNVNIGTGTDIDADSPGAGLLGHNRAYSAWLDGLFSRHPDLVIENCSSGAMRVDYAQLSRMSIQSTSDQQDPVRNVTIATAAPSAVTPEQAAVWAYPQPDYGNDLNALTLVAAMLGRIHLSGRIDQLDEKQQAELARAIGVYKDIRGRIPRGLPYWPLGLPQWHDPWTALALRDGTGTLVAAFRRGGDEAAGLSLPFLSDAPRPTVLFGAEADLRWDPAKSTLHVRLPDCPSAVLISLGE